MAAKKSKTTPAASPTSLTMQHCKKKGALCGIVETFVHFPPPGHRKDLFGVIDMVACVPGVGILGIQATSATNVSARLRKAKREPRLRAWLDAGARFEVWGWGKAGNRITLRREEVTVDQLIEDDDDE